MTTNNERVADTSKTIVVEKEVYEAVLRNSVKVADLEAENMQLRQFCEEFNALSVAKENQKLKELLIDFVKRMEHYKEVKPDVGFIMFDLGYLTNQVKEALNG